MSYLKRYAAPKTWIIARKETKYIVNPMPGAHPLTAGLPLSFVLKSLGYADNAKEARKVVVHKDVLVDCRKTRMPKHLIGLMDTLSIPATDEHYRIIIDRKGRLVPVKISKELASIKPSRVVNKVVRKGGKVQLCTNDGRVINDAKANVGDTVLIHLPEQKVKEHLALGPKSIILLTGGRHIGETGTVESLSGTVVRYASNNQVFETRKGYAFVIPQSMEKIFNEHNAKATD